MKKISISILSVLALAFCVSSAFADGKITRTRGRSMLITNDGDDLVTLTVSGNPAKKLYESITAKYTESFTDPKTRATRTEKTADAILCALTSTPTDDGDADLAYQCVYTFRSDGTIIN
jgi:hypothetical protein